MSAPSSLSQGQTFDRLTAGLHGGRRGSRRGSRRSRRNTRRNMRRRRNMMGGAADYPSQFSELLPNGMHAAADVSKLDAAFAQLPQFVGKYGGVGGSRRASKSKRRASKSKRAHRGGGFGYTPGATNVPNYMILSPAEEPKAFLNPQWYTENEVVPTFKGPENAFAQQSYNNQFNYAQRAGSRKRRSCRKNSCKKGRKGSRPH